MGKNTGISTIEKMKKLTEKELKELEKDIKPQEVDVAKMFLTLKSMPREEAREIVNKMQKSNTKEFPKLAKLMVEKKLLTQKELDEKWNHRDMYEIFLYILGGDIQRASERGEDVVMVTTSEFKLKRKGAIKRKFAIRIVDPKKAVEMMKKDDPKGFKKFEDEMDFQEKKATDYIG